MIPRLGEPMSPDLSAALARDGTAVRGTRLMLETSDFVVGASACPDLHVLAPVCSRNACLDHLTPQVDNDTNGMMIPRKRRHIYRRQTAEARLS